MVTDENKFEFQEMEFLFCSVCTFIVSLLLQIQNKRIV